jgi:hypothetical protein
MAIGLIRDNTRPEFTRILKDIFSKNIITLKTLSTIEILPTLYDT